MISNSWSREYEVFRREGRQECDKCLSERGPKYAGLPDLNGILMEYRICLSPAGLSLESDSLRLTTWINKRIYHLPIYNGCLRSLCSRTKFLK